MSRTDDAMWAHNRYILGKQVFSFSLIFNAWLKIIGNNMNKKSFFKKKKIEKNIFIGTFKYNQSTLDLVVLLVCTVLYIVSRYVFEGTYLPT